MAATETQPVEAHTCPTCGKQFADAQRLGTHRASAHGYRSRRKQLELANDGKKVKQSSTREITKTIKRELDLAEIVSRLYPKGIPTQDVAALSVILTEISDLRERLGGR